MPRLIKFNANGTFEAPVQVFDASKGKWVDKKFESTFFPPSWSQARIEYEVSEAFKKGVPGTRFDTPSPSGIHYQYNSVTCKAYDMKIVTPQPSVLQPGTSIR